ncbi:hypothetical protein [Pseudomonas avellanae]|uniref:hypothetical protein n=1 Tax=Pseudomonas avellanae TaxID=46257 RepID=UPI00201B4722|nr:hypothetical protein [Pseudomonas avellanae]UQW77188.1 hypothetical protein L2Y01_28140 [Pseudomonas avellanae]
MGLMTKLKSMFRLLRDRKNGRFAAAGCPVRTGMFNPDEAKYANGILVELPYPTNDVRLITKAAVHV